MEEIKQFFTEYDGDGPYGVSVIDIDYLIRFCLRLNAVDISGIMNNIHIYIQRALPQEARVWKSHGDEFLIIYPGLSRHDLAQYMLRLKRGFKKEKFTERISEVYSNVPITFSAGVASFPGDGHTLEEVIKKAMVGLFLAKAHRRNTVYEAPDTSMAGMEKTLLQPGLNVNVVLGQYGEVGSVSDSLIHSDIRLWEPQAIETDTWGHLYIVDQDNHYVLRCNGAYVYRIVGDGSYGYSGDGGPGTEARLNKPTGMAIYENRLYITDTGNDVVRMLDMESGIITTSAGTGDSGYLGDGGPATLAKLNKPGGAAVDSDGNLYINDIANNVIRKVDCRGIITTYAGNGSYGYSGDGGLAREATFAEIYGICTGNSPGDLYIADYFNHCVRKIDGGTGIITTVVGTGECGYSGDGGNPLMARLNRPVAVHVDSHENLFIAESGNNCVRILISQADKVYTLVGDGVYGIGQPGPVDGFRLANPNGLTTDDNGQLYILDGANNRVCAIFLEPMEVH